NTMVQGAWALLLSRYSGERDVVFGTTVSGRPPELPGVESMVGMFINTVPTRVTVQSGQPTGEWLRELQARESDARRFDFTALSQLQTLSGVSGSLFDSAVVFENYPFDDTAGAQEGLRVRDVRAVDTTNFPLTLSAYLADLDGRANRLAHRLIAARVGPERVVAVALPRSAMVVAVLAVAKAGGVYLPVDPELPPERIRFLLRDAGAALMLTTTVHGGAI